MGSDELITDAERQDAPEWAWKLSEAIVLGNQGYGNAAVLIHRAFTAQLAEAAEAENAKLREALTRQGDNMAFALNNMPVPAQWYDKFSRELAEDRAALGEPA